MKKIKLIHSRLRNRLVNVSSTLSLADRQRFVTILRLHAWRLISVSTGKIKISPRLRRFNKFLELLLRAYRHHGATYVVKWLKACHVVVQRKLSSVPAKSLRELERDYPLPRLINGLPSFIGTQDRRAIRLNHPGTIRLWLTILSLYRVLECPVKLNLGTITNPSGSDKSAEKILISQMKDIINFNKIGRSLSSLSAHSVHKTVAAGPNYSVAIRGLFTDALAWAMYPDILEDLKGYALETGSSLMHTLEHCIEFSTALLTTGDSWLVRSKSVIDPSYLTLGKLAFKIEAAGKVRVFAICDIWTQSFFKPLHEDLFAFLKGLPNDGTFNQDRSFERCMEKAKRYGMAFCYDLSSATDRLPIAIQGQIIDLIYGSKTLGNFWVNILTKRPFVVRSKQFPELVDKAFHYNTGQPMGCLSSWAMLAVTHHLIVQSAAFRAYGTRKWFDKYEVLGDDIVIFDNHVAFYYLEIMKQLDVGINLSKSLTSERLQTLEFAKRTSVEGIDVSGLSWKQLISENTFNGRVNFVLSMLNKGFIKDPAMLVRAMMDTPFNRFQDVFKLQSLNTRIGYGLTSLLGHFSEVGKITLESVVALLIDPSYKGGMKGFKPSIPVMRALRLIMDICVLGKVFTTNDLIRSYMNNPRLMFSERITERIACMTLSKAIQRLEKFIADYESTLNNLVPLMVSDGAYSDLSATDKLLLKMHTERALMKDSQPEVLLEQINRFVSNLETGVPKLEDAMNFSMKVDLMISQLDLDQADKTYGKADLPSILKDIDLSKRFRPLHSGLANRPLGQLLQQLERSPGLMAPSSNLAEWALLFPRPSKEKATVFLGKDPNLDHTIQNMVNKGDIRFYDDAGKRISEVEFRPDPNQIPKGDDRDLKESPKPPTPPTNHGSSVPSNKKWDKHDEAALKFFGLL